MYRTLSLHEGFYFITIQYAKVRYLTLIYTMAISFWIFKDIINVYIKKKNVTLQTNMRYSAYIFSKCNGI